MADSSRPARSSRRTWEPLTVRFLRWLWRYKLTPGGRILFWNVAFTAAGAVTVQISVYQMFCVLTALSIAVAATNRLLRPRLSVKGELPHRATAGDEFQVEFELTNQSRWPAYDLMLWMIDLPRSIQFLSPDVALPRLAPGESARLPLRLRPSRRGIYALPDLLPHSTFPFNLLRSRKEPVPVGSLTVLPRFHPLEHFDVPTGLRYQPGGVAPGLRAGDSPEYIGNREYVPGMPARRLDFRSWARLGRPVVREYQEEYYCRIALILDTWQPARRVPPDGFPALEAAISLTASLADWLAETEYLIDIFAAGPELHVFRAGRQLAHFDSVLEILAGVEHSRTDPFRELTPAVAEELESITTTLCIFLDWDDAREQLVRTVLDAGSELKVFVVRDTPTTRPLPDDIRQIQQLTPDSIQSGRVDHL